MVVYLIMIFIKPEIEIIVFSFKGLIIAVIVLTIFAYLGVYIISLVI